MGILLMAVSSMSQQTTATHFEYKGSTINPSFQEEKCRQREDATSTRSVLVGDISQVLAEHADSPASMASSHHSRLSIQYTGVPPKNSCSTLI